MIDEEEKNKRQKRFEQNSANQNIEGLVVPDEAQAIRNRYIKGEITANERAELMLALAHRGPIP